MITTRATEKYTKLALDTFFQNTTLYNDQVVLIDNDNTGFVDDRVIIHTNETPKSFAQNLNMIINHAATQQADVVILNNDVVFTKNWLQPIIGYSNCILIPSCNQTHQYEGIPNTLNLDQYDEYALSRALKQHKESNKGFFESLLMPFYVFCLPYNVYSKVGLFDETFDKAGGEDVDYRIRAIQAGFSVKYSSSSYLLHFQGKSTWHGPESRDQTQARNKSYYNTFVSKYNKDIADLFLSTDRVFSVITKYQLYDFINSNDFSGLIKDMLYNHSLGGKAPYRLISGPGLVEYIKKIPGPIVGCELGICLGFTLRHILDEVAQVEKVYAIDAYKPYQDWWGFVGQEMIDTWREAMVDRLSAHADKIEFIEEYTDKAAQYVPDDSLDYIFIDGDHSYDAVSRDLRSYWPKVKNGGIFAGHDWNLPDVNRAVKDFRKEYGIYTDMKFCEKNVWLWYK